MPLLEVVHPCFLSKRLFAGLLLQIEAMEVVDDSELAVNPLPDLLDHPEIAKEIRAIRSEYDLEKRLMVRQGLAPPAETSAIQPIDDQHPILDEDCEITSDQEEALEAQEGWGPTQSQQPSDSQLINENGSVPMMPESQEEDSVMASQPLETSHFSVETESSSQDAHFQKENIRQTFVQCDDLDSDEELSHDESQDQDLQETSKADEKRMELQGDSIQVPLFTSRSEDSVDHSHEDSELESTQRLDDPNVTLDVEDSEVNLPEEPCTQAPDSPYIDGTMPDLNSGESQYLADEDLNDEWHTQPNVDTLLFDLSSQAPEDVINDDVVVDDFVPRTPPGSTEQSNTSQPRESSLPGITSGANSDAIAEPEQSPSPLPDVESKRKRFETSEAEKDSQPSNSTEERAAFDAEADVIIEPEQPPTSLSPVRESKRKRIATSDVIRPAKVSRSSNFTDERRVTFSVDNTDKQTPLNNSRQKKKSQIQDQLSSVRSRSSSAAPAPIVPAFLLAKDRVVVKMPFEFPVWRKPDTSISPLIRPSKRYADLFPPLDMERIKRMLEE